MEAARSEFDIRRRQLTEAMQPLCDRANESARIANAAYREAGADLLRLLDAERVRIESQMLLYRTLT